MNRQEWIVVIVLTLATVLSLTLAPSLDPGREQALAMPLQPATPGPTEAAPATATGIATAAFATQTPVRSPMPTHTTTSTSTIAPTPTQTPTATPSPTPSPTGWPFDHHPELGRFVYVDQYSQHMYVFEHGELIRDIPCSCGLPESDKYTEEWSGTIGSYWGTFFAFDVYADEAWYLYKSLGSILVHSLPYTYQNGYKVYQDRDALGVRPSSHGCVRISPENAEWFTAWGPEGVRMDISDPYLEKWR